MVSFYIVCHVSFREGTLPKTNSHFTPENEAETTPQKERLGLCFQNKTQFFAGVSTGC